MSDPASEHPVAPDLATAPTYHHWHTFDDRERILFVGVPQGAGFDVTWMELAAIDVEGGWARDVDGFLIRLGVRLPKTDRDPKFEDHFGEDFRRHLLACFHEANKQGGR